MGDGPFERTIRSLRGGGRALPATTRTFLESRLGADLGGVRIHTGSTADGLARSIGATAFTVGRDVVFASGAYRPNTRRGTHLLAHELTHVIQGSDRSQHRPPGQPQTIHRAVRRDNVSCAEYPDHYPIFTVIGTTNPVQTLEAADAQAIDLLDRAIQTLNAATHQVRAQSGDPSVPGTIPEFLGDALFYNLGLQPTDRDVWTNTGIGTVDVVIRRFQAAKEMLESGGIRYTCLGEECPGRNAYVLDPRGPQPPASRIYLCGSWWTELSMLEKASTLVHEVLHIYFAGFLLHSSGLGDAENYEQFIEDVWNRRTRH